MEIIICGEDESRTLGAKYAVSLEALTDWEIAEIAKELELFVVDATAINLGRVVPCATIAAAREIVTKIRAKTKP